MFKTMLRSMLALVLCVPFISVMGQDAVDPTLCTSPPCGDYEKCILTPAILKFGSNMNAISYTCFPDIEKLTQLAGPDVQVGDGITIDPINQGNPVNPVVPAPSV